MLDLTGILFSSVMMLMVIVRAVRLDRLQPWFQAINRSESDGSKSPQPWRRQG
jgi:hypothetical protein